MALQQINTRPIMKNKESDGNKIDDRGSATHESVRK
jgi:hypothetical protein